MGKKGIFTKLSYEDKFSRMFACWANNHCKAWSDYKKRNRQTARNRLKEELKNEIKNIDE